MRNLLCRWGFHNWLREVERYDKDITTEGVTNETRYVQRECGCGYVYTSNDVRTVSEFHPLQPIVTVANGWEIAISDCLKGAK